MRSLERFRGHFYNWYDTIGLRAAFAPLRVHRGQRESRRSSPGPRPCLPPGGRWPAAGSASARGNRGRRPARRRGGADPRRRPAHPDGDPDRSRSGVPGPGRRAPRPPPDRGRLGGPPRALAAQAEALVDIARVLTAERGDGAHCRPPRLGAGGPRHHREPRARSRDDHAVGAASGVPADMAVADGARGPNGDRVPLLDRLSPRPMSPPAATSRSARSPRVAIRASARRPSRRARSRASMRPSARWSAPRSPSRALVRRLLAVAQVTKELFDGMQFGFLVDPTRKIFSIGYRVMDGGLDPSAYDLLASEARLASFIAIAKGDVPVGAVVPPRPPDDAGCARLGARVLVRFHVRVSDAGARHGLPARAVCSTRRTVWSCSARSATGRSAGSPGASPNRPTTCATWI